MDKQAIKDALHKGRVIIQFKKANGEFREMKCTLSEDLIPATTVSVDAKTVRKENPDVQAVWDLDKHAWRSFRFDSVTNVQF